MTTVFDYLKWRGDLSFAASPFNEIDALILSELAYLKVGGIVSSEFGVPGVPLSRMTQEFFEAPDMKERSDMGILFGNKILELFRLAAASRRFGPMQVCGFQEELDQECEKQFSAMTFVLEDGSLFLSFRGTDDTIVGWKEDLNMTFMAPVPAQESALGYLLQAASAIPGNIRLGGHSKGGNIAVYAAAFCPQEIQDRILSVYNNDGPGFDRSLVLRKEFRAISDRVFVYVPQGSIVGLLLEQDEDYIVVKSHESGLLQHDPLSWQLEGPRFKTVEKLSSDSMLIDRSIKGWLNELEPQEREQFVDGLYAILVSSQASTLSELVDNWKTNPGKAINAILQVESGTRKVVLAALQQLLKSVHAEWRMDIKSLLQEKLEGLLAP